MKKILQFITWPAIAGVLAAIALLQWYATSRPAVLAPAGLTRTSFSQAVQRAVPSVVNIYTRKRVPARPDPALDNPYARRLLDGACFSIEPGIYGDAFGVRTEINAYVNGSKLVVSGGAAQRAVLTL